MASIKATSETHQLSVIKKEEEEEVKISECDDDSQGEKKTRTAYFTPVELELLMTAYAKYEPALRRKGNTIAAAKERELAWQKVADQVNAFNPTGTKRTWQQLKMKYKNILQTANRKKAEARRTGGGRTTSSEVEKIAISRQPVAEGLSGGTSSDSTSTQDTSPYGCAMTHLHCSQQVQWPLGATVLILNSSSVTDGVITPEPSAITDINADDDEDTSSANIKKEHTERLIESKAGNYNEEGPSTSTAQLASLPVKELYKVYLEKQIQKCDLEMEHIRVETQKTRMEIQLLEHQVEGIKKTP